MIPLTMVEFRPELRLRCERVMKLSKFGEIITRPSAIVELMEDLGEALNNNPDILFLGGGNPAQVPQAQQLFRRHVQALSGEEAQLEELLGIYQSPRGDERLLAELLPYLQRTCRWPLQPNNLALLSGSQSAFFIILNLFAGETPDGKVKKIALPLVPEYLGYRSQGLSPEHFTVFQPTITYTAKHRFKYAIDFSRLSLTDDIGAMCVSRPTNPSGNLLSDGEVENLLQLCRGKNIPLVVDLAYGKPFPGVVYQPCNSTWAPGMIAVMSLSKLGLPGVRSAVVVADPETIEMVVRANTIINLANGNLGPALMQRLVASGDLDKLTDEILPHFYRQQRDTLISLIDTHLAAFPYRIHEPEGAFFLWLWLEDLPISSAELYQRLKQKGLLLMAGEPFFFGLEDSWPHARQCVRLTYCQTEDILTKAIFGLAEELNSVYG